MNTAPAPHPPRLVPVTALTTVGRMVLVLDG